MEGNCISSRFDLPWQPWPNNVLRGDPFAQSWQNPSWIQAAIRERADRVAKKWPSLLCTSGSSAFLNCCSSSVMSGRGEFDNMSRISRTVALKSPLRSCGGIGQKVVSSDLTPHPRHSLSAGIWPKIPNSSTLRVGMLACDPNEFTPTLCDPLVIRLTLGKVRS